MKGIKNENDGKKSLHGIRRNGIRRNGKTTYGVMRRSQEETESRPRRENHISKTSRNKTDVSRVVVSISVSPQPKL